MKIKIADNEGIAGFVFKNKRPYISNTPYSDNKFNKKIDELNNFKTNSLLCVPILDKDNKQFGVIQAINKKDGQVFTSDDIELMDAFSASLFYTKEFN